MSLVGCFVTPHPPIVVPAVGGNRLGEVAATADAMSSLGRRAEELRPDVVVLMSPHARLEARRMGVSTCARYDGSLAYFGAPEVCVMLDGDADLAQAILSEASARDVAAAPMAAPGDVMELDHGSMVPLVYIAKDLDPAPALVLLGFSDLDRESHLVFGAAVGAAVDARESRVLYVCSGDLSHRLTPGAPAGFDPRAAEFDRAVVEALRTGSQEALLAIPPRLQYEAGECGYRSLVTLFGLLSGRRYETEVLSYEGPFGVGYLVGVVDLPSRS